MFHFVKKPGAPNSASKEGMYIEDVPKGFINGKPVYVNKEKNTVLAAHPSSGWCITGLEYWDEIKSKQGRFGGFCFGGGETPADGSWPAFTVEEKGGYIFSLKPGAANRADCDGSYFLDAAVGKINGKPVYVNKPRYRFLAAEPQDGWCITSIKWLDEIRQRTDRFGGYHFADGSKPEDGIWKEYNVVKFGPIDEALYKKDAWKKFESNCVSYKSVGSSGIVRTEKDFQAARKQCISLDCAGFSWKKPHFNQFGEEDDLPICFYYRKTQKQLREDLHFSTENDFYIAPDKFTPDTSFKPFRDPAPSCHVWWTVDKPAFSFACQVVVPEPTAYTYYCMGGYHCGYSGIQQHGGSTKRVLFSVWNDKTAKAKVANLYVCPDMIAQPFDGQGMGMQSFGISGDPSASKICPHADWKPGVPYTFVVRAFPATDATEYVSYFYNPGFGWQLLARFSRPDTDLKLRGKLTGLYSFLQDFGKNTRRRSAKYAGWVQYDPNGAWEPVRQIVGTSTAEDSEPNKSVRLVSEGSHQVVEMVAGGEALDDYMLYKGSIANPLPVPGILEDLP